MAKKESIAQLLAFDHAIIQAQNSRTKSAREFLKSVRMVEGKVKIYGDRAIIAKFSDNLLANLDDFNTNDPEKIVAAIKKSLPPEGRILGKGESPNAPKLNSVFGRGRKADARNVETAQKVFAVMRNENMEYKKARKVVWERMTDKEKAYWSWSIDNYRRAMDAQFGRKKRN